MLSFSLLFLAGFLHPVAASRTPQCYCKNMGRIVPCDAPAACGSSPDPSGHYQCCDTTDTCGGQAVCRFTHQLANGSGFYLAACTDSTFQAPSCRQQCSQFPTQDVVYNQQTGQWSCCWDSQGREMDCGNPGPVSFNAPSPQVLFAQPFSAYTAAQASPTTLSIILRPTTSSIINVVQSNSAVAASSNNPSNTPSTPSASSVSSASQPSSAAGTLVISNSPSTSATNDGAASSSIAAATNASAAASQSTISSTIQSAATATVTVVTQDTSSLTTGAKAGIGIGVALGILALMALGFLLFRRRRFSKIPDTLPSQTDSDTKPKFQYAEPVPMYDVKHEMPGWREPPRSELPAYNYSDRPRPSELGS